MKRIAVAAAVLVMVASAQASAAQPVASDRAKQFADTFAQMQRESSNSYFPATATASKPGSDPLRGWSLADMESASSDHVVWPPGPGKAPTTGHQSRVRHNADGVRYTVPRSMVPGSAE